MAHRYQAMILLDEPWRPETDSLSELLTTRFPELGAVAPAPESEPAGMGIARSDLIVDGAQVGVAYHPDPVELPPAQAGLRPAEPLDRYGALDRHGTHIVVSCGGEGGGLAWTKAYASVVTLIAGALSRIAPSGGVLYPASRVVLAPEEALRAGRTCLKGVSPIEAWLSVYAVAPSNPGAPEAMGAVSLGLAPFLGREIELAPAPISAQKAVDRLRGAAWQALDGEEIWTDGAELSDPLRTTSSRVRAAADWLRPGVPAFVLLTDDSVIDVETLGLRTPVAGPLLGGLGAVEPLGMLRDGLGRLSTRLARNEAPEGEARGLSPLTAVTRAAKGAAITARRRLRAKLGSGSDTGATSL